MSSSYVSAPLRFPRLSCRISNSICPQVKAYSVAMSGTNISGRYTHLFYPMPWVHQRNYAFMPTLLCPSTLSPPWHDTTHLQVMGVDPPRPVPELAYDLQTVLESVQHFATQTLAAVVTAQATKKDLDADFGSQGVRSPRMTMGGRGTAAAKEAKEGDAAAGSRVGWRALWPPEKLTAALGLVTAKQMAHAMRCDAEPLIQVSSGAQTVWYSFRGNALCFI